MNTQDLTTLTPSEFDQMLATVYGQHQINLSALESAIQSVHRAVGDRREGYGRYARWTMTDQEAEDKVTAIAGDGGPYSRNAQNTLDAFQAEQESVKATRAQIDIYDRAFDARGGWSRFFLVSNVNGHIHSSMHCSTCRPTTRFGWLPEVSGKSEAEAVAEHGAMLCTVCFPSAPLEWTNHWEKLEEAKKAASCSGSGTYQWVEGSTRFGYAAGNGGTCAVCNGYAAATSSMKIRKHKPGK